ncbi:MAG: protein translocase subunit SecD [Pseudomonadota bacterium]|nr:protein translocase subunit SecD [Pseudomonadota bacterium]
MLKPYPFWKSLLFIAVVLGCFFYALPNLYTQQPALQINAQKAGTELPPNLLDDIQSVLGQADISLTDAEASSTDLTLFFSNTNDRRAARDRVQAAVGNDYVVALNTIARTPSVFSAIGADPLKLGLDLRGGVHFLLEVDVEKKLQTYEKSMLDGLRQTLREELEAGQRYGRYQMLSPNGFELAFNSEQARDNAKSIARDVLGFEYETKAGEFNDQPSLRFQLTETALFNINRETVEQNRIALSNRINEIGVAEPLVQQQGAERILVQLPGVEDTAQAKRVIGRTADLEFRLVKGSGRVGSTTLPNTEVLNRKDGGQILLNAQPIVTGQNVIDASATFDQNGQPAVSIGLDSAGGRNMLRTTQDNVGNLMSVVFIESKAEPTFVEENGEQVLVFKKREERQVINTATINGVFGNQFQITGLDSLPEANELALLLRSGALAAPMYIVEERTIGPSLGAENIRKGFMSLVIGFALVIIFMIIKYRVYGVLANIALFSNLIIIAAVLSFFGATLTLPGIAGIVLTVGMAVDANVLIFSRIKEEFKKGMRSADAVEEGFAKALSAIVDANITTLIIAVILLFLATGSVKGFAVTLAIGILTSMFTALIGTRALIQWVYGRKKLKTINMG